MTLTTLSPCRWVPSNLLGSALFSSASYFEVKRGYGAPPLVSSGAITIAMWIRHDVDVDEESVLVVSNICINFSNRYGF